MKPFKNETLTTSSKCESDTIYPHGNKKGYDAVGVLMGKGINCGRIVWEGPLLGLFFYNGAGNRSNITDKKLIKYFK